MITLYLYALMSVLIVSAISLVGALVFSLKEESLKKYIFIFIALAVGSLLGDSFLHLIPESLENFPGKAAPSILIVAGILAFFILEKFFHWHHHGEDKSEPHIHPVGNLVLISDGIHNVIDGIIIGASFFVSVPIGIATTIAVILHEIPQEIGDFMVLLHSGYKRTRALWLNFLSALGAIGGVVVAFILGEAGKDFVNLVLPLAAGGFIYIAVADLIPELHKTKEMGRSIIQIMAVIIGVLAMLALLYIG